MKKILSLCFLAALISISCDKEDELIEENSNNTETKSTEASEDLEIEDFVYKGMNEFYLYKSEVPALNDSYFDSEQDQLDFYSSFSSPETLFDKLLVNYDKYSFITNDYEALENRFDGVSGATGIEFGIGRINGTSNFFGFVQYVLPNTSAEEAGLERGTVFTEVNGQQITANNINNLLNQDPITINIGKVENGAIVLEDRTVTLTDDPYTENPIYFTKVFNIEGNKIAYLIYNSFTSDFDDELNTVFAGFKNEGVTDLILDLRYNGGGSLESAVDLASMITGQFEGEIFLKQQWNERYQSFFENNDPESLNNRFNATIRTGATINSLNLDQVYILTAKSTASASESLINGLDPYIDVIQIGDATTGKFQGSITLYDSPDFTKKNINPNHTYALQPLVIKAINSVGETDFVNGLQADIAYVENLNNLGILGETDEPLLALALKEITGTDFTAQNRTDQSQYKNNILMVSGAVKSVKDMYINNIPPRLK